MLLFTGCGSCCDTAESSADASPTEVELPVWTQVDEVLQRTDEILLELGVYRGATLQIRDVSGPRCAQWQCASSLVSVTAVFTSAKEVMYSSVFVCLLAAVCFIVTL